jgi:peptidylprolyl isomerase
LLGSLVHCSTPIADSLRYVAFGTRTVREYIRRVSTTPPTRTAKRQRKKEGQQARRAAELAALRRQQRNRRIVRFALIAGVAIAALVGLQALGGDDDEGEQTGPSTSTIPAESEDRDEATATEPIECEPPTGENTDMATKPTVTVPDEPATDLTCVDLVVGDGDEATGPSDTVTVHYVGVGQASGEEFDASWGGEPATFRLDGVIAGWTEGIPGMKVGGRRLLTIPGDKAYPDGRPGIEPGETLVFIVDLLEVTPGS